MAEEKVRADVLADDPSRAVLAAFPDAELETFPNQSRMTCPTSTKS